MESKLWGEAIIASSPKVTALVRVKSDAEIRYPESLDQLQKTVDLFVSGVS